MNSPILPNSWDCRAGRGDVGRDEGWDRLGREIGEEWSVPLWSTPPDWPPDLFDNRLSFSFLTQARETGILEGVFFLFDMKDLMIIWRCFLECWPSTENHWQLERRVSARAVETWWAWCGFRHWVHGTVSFRILASASSAQNFNASEFQCSVTLTLDNLCLLPLVSTVFKHFKKRVFYQEFYFQWVEILNYIN